MEHAVLRLSMHEAEFMHNRNWASFRQLLCSQWASNYKVFCSNRLVPTTADAHLLTSPLRDLEVPELLQLRDLLADLEELGERAVGSHPLPGFTLWCYSADQ